MFGDIRPQTIVLGLTSDEHIPRTLNGELNIMVLFFAASSWRVVAHEDAKSAHTHVHSPCIAAFAANGKFLAVFLQTNGSSCLCFSTSGFLNAITKLLSCL